MDLALLRLTFEKVCDRSGRALHREQNLELPLSRVVLQDGLGFLGTGLRPQLLGLTGTHPFQRRPRQCAETFRDVSDFSLGLGGGAQLSLESSESDLRLLA